MKHFGDYKSDLATEGLVSFIELDQKLFPWPWSSEQWREALAKDSYSLHFLKDGNELIGFALYSCSKLEGLVHLLKILIKTEYRGTPCATELFNWSQSYFKKLKYESIYLEVATDNNAAFKFYKKLGFVQLVVKKKYYSDGKDASAMSLSIN